MLLALQPSFYAPSSHHLPKAPQVRSVRSPILTLASVILKDPEGSFQGFQLSQEIPVYYRESLSPQHWNTEENSNLLQFLASVLATQPAQRQTSSVVSWGTWPIQFLLSSVQRGTSANALLVSPSLAAASARPVQILSL